MHKIRINRDVYLIAEMYENGDPADMSSVQDLSVMIIRQQTYNPNPIIEKFSIKDNKIIFQFSSIENIQLGIFRVLIKYKRYASDSETEYNQYYKDFIDAFEVVEYSDDDTINAGILSLNADVAIYGKNGKDFKYSDFTDEQIEELKKPATDASKIAYAAAQKAIDNANLAKENAERAEKSAETCDNTNKSVSDAETSRVTEFGSLKTASEYATSAATSAANAANSAAGHSPKIVDSVWQVWDNSTQAYVSTGIKAVGADGITPQIRINSDTKNWETSVDGGTTWVNTGVSSISTNAEVVQVSGHETGKVISQKAVTDAILNSFDQLNFTIFENSDGSIYKKIFTTPLADSVSLGVDINSVSVYALPDMSNLTTLYYRFSNYNFTNFYAKIKTSDKLIRMDQILDRCVNLLSFDFTYFDTSNVTTLYYAMHGCINLKIIIGVINAKSVKRVAGFLDGCGNLEYFSGLAELKCSLYLKDCVKITHDSLISIIANLADMTTSDNQTWATNNNLTTTPTLTLGSTNLAKLTDAEKKVATDKGWILA